MAKRHKISLNRAKNKSLVSRFIALIIILIILGTVIFFSAKQDKGTVVATVEGEKIYSNRIDAIYNSLGYNSTALKNRILWRLVDSKILVDYLEKNGYGLSDEEFESLLSQKLKTEGTTLSQLKKELAVRYATLDDVRESFMIEKFVKSEIEPKIKIEDSEIVLYKKLNNVVGLSDEEAKNIVFGNRVESMIKDIVLNHTYTIAYTVNEEYIDSNKVQ